MAVDDSTPLFHGEIMAERAGVGDIIAKFNKLKGIKPGDLQQIPPQHQRIHDDEVRLGQYDVSDPGDLVVPPASAPPCLQQASHYHDNVDERTANNGGLRALTLRPIEDDLTRASSSECLWETARMHASLSEGQGHGIGENVQRPREQNSEGNDFPRSPSIRSQISKSAAVSTTGSTSGSDADTVIHIALEQQKDIPDGRPQWAFDPTSNQSDDETTPLLHELSTQLLVAKPPHQSLSSRLGQAYLGFKGFVPRRDRFIDTWDSNDGVFHGARTALSSGANRIRGSCGDPRARASMVILACFVGITIVVIFCWR